MAAWLQHRCCTAALQEEAQLLRDRLEQLQRAAHIQGALEAGPVPPPSPGLAAAAEAEGGDAAQEDEPACVEKQQAQQAALLLGLVSSVAE